MNEATSSLLAQEKEAEMETIRLFITYSTSDRAFRERLGFHLANSQGTEFRLKVFDDHEDIAAGEKIGPLLRTEIERADIHLVLLSVNYLRRWQSRDTNFRRAEFELLESRPYVIPILLDDCPWEAVREFRSLEDRTILPGRNVWVSSNADDAERQWYVIAKRIRETARKVAAARSTPNSGSRPEGWASGTEKEAPNAAEFLRIAATTGRITPVLGPGCYETRENRARAAAHVRRKRKLLLEALKQVPELTKPRTDPEVGGKKPKTDLEACSDYVESLVADASKSPRRRSETSLGAGPSPENEFEQAVVDLQVLIVRSSVALIRLFAEAMKESMNGISDLGSYSVPVSLDAENARKVSQLLSDAQDLVLGIGKRWPNSDRHGGLGATGIGLHLDDLMARVRVGQGELRLVELAWLGDLLWHLLRFEAPMYPSAEELGFQLAVCSAARTPSRRAHYAAAAMLVAEGQQGPLLARWFKNYRLPPGPRREGSFYDALAQALCVNAPEPSNVAPALDSPTRQFVPVALSCNLDQELEQAIAALGRSFHVVFPLRISYSVLGGRTQSTARWILRKVQAGRGGTTETVSTSVLDEKVQGGHLAVDRGKYIGPLIVKLHGSPLDEVPDASTLLAMPGIGLERGTQIEAITHRLVFSDLQLLANALSGEALLPPGLKELLGEKGRRLFCFFGFPLRDPSSRLRILRTLETAPSALVQEFPRDDLRFCFLEGFSSREVHYYNEELDTVARVIGGELGGGQGGEQGAANV